MKKILIIVPSGLSFNENSLFKQGVGGSETWAIQLSNALRNLGNSVTIVGMCSTHVAESGIEYFSTSEMDKILKTRKFDLVIISRQHSDILDKIDSYKTTDNAIIQAHDPDIVGNSFNSIKDLPCFRGVSTLSAYQERKLHDNCGVDWRYMARIGNGIDIELFKNLDFTARNKRLLHSSCYQRGGRIVEKDILPKYLKTITEGGVDFCSYDTCSTCNSENVNVLGSLSKPDLYRNMSERYCWFYPLINDETFCITMIENVMCENDIILPLNYGCSSILEPFNNDITMKHNFISGDGEFILAVDEACERIIESINNRDKGRKLREELKNYVISKYDWNVIAKKWLSLI